MGQDQGQFLIFESFDNFDQEGKEGDCLCQEKANKRCDDFLLDFTNRQLNSWPVTKV